MTKSDWIDYFVAINGRQPSAEEISQAAANNEFEKNSIADTVKASAGMAKDKVPDSILAMFAGIDKAWLFREYVFAIIFSLFFLTQSGESGVGIKILCIVNTLFYPYSRFVFDSIFGFFLRNVFFIFSVWWYIFLAKLIVFSIVWFLAVPVGTIGLLYFYFKINGFKK